MPDKTIPIAPSPTSWARERKKWSMGSVRAWLGSLSVSSKLAAGDDHLLLGRNEIDGVRLHGHTVLDAADGDGRPPCQQFVHEAAEVRREVLNDDEGQPRLGGHLVEELFQGFKPARRGSNAYHVLWLVQHTAVRCILARVADWLRCYPCEHA